MKERLQLLIEVDDRGSPRVSKLGQDLDRTLGKATRDANRHFSGMQQSVSQSLDNVSRRVVQFGTLTGAVFAGLAARSVITLGAEFGKQMSAVQAVSQSTEKELAQLRDQAKQLGETTQFSASQAGAAMEQLGLSGFTAAEQMQAMPDVLNLAAAGSLDMAEAASIASDVMRGMGIEARDFRHAADVLAEAAANANQTVRDVGVSFTYVAPVAKAAGVSLEETAAAMSLLANRGIRASMAGTSLRRAISVMLGDLEEGEKGLGSFGLQLTDANGKFVGLTEAIRQMNAAGLQTNDVMAAFGQRAGPAMLALLDAGEGELRRFTEQLENAEGAAEEMGRVRLDNFLGDMTQLKSAAEGLALAIFDELNPGLRESAQSLTDVVREATKFVQATDTVHGFVRATKVAATGLGLLVAREVFLKVAALTQSFRAATAATTAYGAANATAATSATALTTAMAVQSAQASVMATQFRGLSTAGKFGFGGAVVAAAALGWQIGRIIGEVTGLDQALQDLMDDWFSGPTWEDSAEGVVNRVDMISRSLKGVSAQLVDLGMSPVSFGIDQASVRELYDYMRTARQLRESGQEGLVLGEAYGAKDAAKEVEALLGKMNKWRFAAQRARETNAALWEEAVSGAKSPQDALDRFKALLNETAEEEAAAAAELAKYNEELQKLAEHMGEQLVDVGTVTETQFAAVTDQLSKMLGVMEREGIDVIDVAAGFREEFNAVYDAMTDIQRAKLTPEQLGLLEWADALQDVADAEDRRAARTKETNEALAEQGEELLPALAEAWEDLHSRMAVTDLTYATELLGERIAAALQIAQVEGWDAADVMQAYRGELEQLIERYEELGEELPEWLAAAKEGLADLAEQDELLKLQDELEAGFERIGNSAIAGIGNAVGSALAGIRSLSDGLKGVFQSVLSSVVSLLVQIGIRRLILAKISTGSAASEAAAEFGKAVGLTYANMFASWAAAPWPISIGAPAAATAAATAVSSTTPAWMATGAGLAGTLGGATAMAEGGLVTGPTYAHIGEDPGTAPEAVLPLRGPAAARVRRELGLEGAGSGGVTIERLEVNLSGSFFADEGLPDRVVRQVRNALDDAIRLGQMRPLAVGTR